MRLTKEEIALLLLAIGVYRNNLASMHELTILSQLKQKLELKLGS